MNDTSLTKLCGIISFLPLLLGLASIPMAVRLGLGVGVPDWSSADTLTRMHAAMPLPLWMLAMAVAAPAFALFAGLGWWQILKRARSVVALGILFWCVGMTLNVIWHVIQVALVAYLPAAFMNADAATRSALLAIGGSLTEVNSAFDLVGNLIAYIGLLILGIATLRLGGAWRVLAAVAITAAVLTCSGLIVPVVVPQFQAAVIGRGIGFFLLFVWVISMGVIMLRWKPTTADPRSYAEERS